MSTTKAPKISATTVQADFNDLVAVMHYTRAAHGLGLWNSERVLIERHFPDRDAPLIEAGCGAGRVTLGMWELGYRNLTAFDFAEELLQQARSLAAERGADRGAHAIRFFHADATRLLQCHPIGDTTAPSPEGPSGSCNLIGDTMAGARGVRPAGAEPGATAVGAAGARTTAVGAAGTCVTGARTAGTCVTGAGAAGAHATARAQGGAKPSGSGFAGALFMFNGLMQIPGRDNRRAALRELHRVCAPGAPLLFTTHDRNHSSTERALWRLERVRWQRGDQDPRLVEFGDRYFEEAGVGRTFMHLPDRTEILADLAATGWTPVFDSMRSKVARETKQVRDFSDECRFWVAHRDR